MDEIRIGDRIQRSGRIYEVRGFSPMSLPEQTVDLADVATGALIRVAAADLCADGEDGAARGGSAAFRWMRRCA